MTLTDVTIRKEFYNQTINHGKRKGGFKAIFFYAGVVV
jgi:hypothetical protein